MSKDGSFAFVGLILAEYIVTISDKRSVLCIHSHELPMRTNITAVIHSSGCEIRFD